MRPFAILLFLPLAAGCGGLLNVNVMVVDQQTALERQVLGTYEQLGEDLALFASVRAVEPDGTLAAPPEVTDSQAAALAALNNRRYNRDDLDALLRSGAVGEGNQGLLLVRDANILEAALPNGLGPRVLEEENADRRVLLRRLVETTPGATPADAPRIAAIFARLNRDLAPEGAPVQDEEGQWQTR